MRGAALCASLASTFVLTTSSLAAPIRVVSPGTGLFLGNVVIGRASFVERSGAGAEVSTIEASVTGLYSPTTNTLFGIVIPYVDKRLDIKGVKDQTTHGLGDIALIGHYRFWNRPKKGYRDMAAGRVVIELPTGSTGRSIDPGVPEPARHALQPGSGSTDVTFLLAVGREHYRYNAIFNASYRLNTEGVRFEFGDRIAVDLSLGAFLFPRWTRAHGFELFAPVELSYRHVEHNELRGTSVQNSGGDSFFVAPGFQCIVSEHLLFETSVRVAAAQSLNGDQPQLDYDALVGLRVAF